MSDANVRRDVHESIQNFTEKNKKNVIYLLPVFKIIAIIRNLTNRKAEKHRTGYKILQVFESFDSNKKIIKCVKNNKISQNGFKKQHTALHPDTTN